MYTFIMKTGGQPGSGGRDQEVWPPDGKRPEGREWQCFLQPPSANDHHPDHPQRGWCDLDVLHGVNNNVDLHGGSWRDGAVTSFTMTAGALSWNQERLPGGCRGGRMA